MKSDFIKLLIPENAPPVKTVAAQSSISPTILNNWDHHNHHYGVTNTRSDVALAQSNLENRGYY